MRSSAKENRTEENKEVGKMRGRTIRACQECGNPFYGAGDYHYCPACAKLKKLDSVVKIRTCQDCGTEFFGGPRARRCPDCAYRAAQETNRKHKKMGTKTPNWEHR